MVDEYECSHLSARRADHFWRMRTRFGGDCTAKIGHPGPILAAADRATSEKFQDCFHTTPRE